MNFAVVLQGGGYAAGGYLEDTSTTSLASRFAVLKKECGNEKQSVLSGYLRRLLTQFCQDKNNDPGQECNGNPQHLLGLPKP